MLKNHFKICLYQPEIPQNTGSIARLAAATGSRLCLIKPLGFSTSDKNLRRAGLDYWPFVDLEVYENSNKLFARHEGKLALFSKKADRLYTEVPPEVDLLVFGRESTGLPDEVLDRYADSLYRLPVFHDKVRSLNVACAASIIVYEQLRKRGLF